MVEDALLIRALRGERGERPPVWFMRQAGRYLPEYRAVRERHSMLDVIRTPELAAQVTLQPLERFALDGAIIFADILNPLIGMGIELDFVEGEGPKIFNPIKSPSDIEKLVVPDPNENTGYTLEAIRRVVSQLTPRGIPLLGFAGAPFTLAWYALGESGKTAHGRAIKDLIYHHPEAWKLLMDRLVEMVATYLIAQVEAGVSAVQIFDSWVGVCAPSTYRQAVFPSVLELVTRVRKATSVPIVYFPLGGIGLADAVRELPVDAVSVDWRVSLSNADAAYQNRFSLQGNLDPVLLFSPLSVVNEETNRILDEGATTSRPHIMNLGHGLLPHTPVEAVAEVVRLVREYRY